MLSVYRCVIVLRRYHVAVLSAVFIVFVLCCNVCCVCVLCGVYRSGGGGVIEITTLT